MYETIDLGLKRSTKIRFFKIFKRLKPEISSTCIGLGLVKRIIESIMGKIWVESEAWVKELPSSLNYLQKKIDLPNLYQYFSSLTIA